MVVNGHPVTSGELQLLILVRVSPAGHGADERKAFGREDKNADHSERLKDHQRAECDVGMW